jgi:hypothetical protein
MVPDSDAMVPDRRPMVPRYLAHDRPSYRPIIPTTSITAKRANVTTQQKYQNSTQNPSKEKQKKMLFIAGSRLEWF